MTTPRSLRPSRFSWFLLPAIATLLGQACADRAGDCDANSACTGGSTTAGSDAGKGGTNPEAGADSGGSSSGKGGTSGNAGSGAAGGGSSSLGGAGGDGGGGAAPMLPCDGACTGDKPVCKVATDTCVECVKPSDCTTGSETKCDTQTNTCVECLAPTDCPTATAAKCDAGTCTECTSNADCAHIAGKTVCDTAAGECVQCTGTDYASCGSDMGTPLVCDTLARTCSTSKEHDSDLCRPCISDAHCPTGQACVKQTFGAPAADVGYFCFWKRGDTANGAPATCSAAKPYSATVTAQISIDGVQGDICGLRSSTCVARNDLADSKDCSTAGSADNAKCGFLAGVDSRCTDVSGDFRCTMACAGADDCPGNLLCDGTSFCKL